MSDDQEQQKPLIAEGVFMTSIRCPNCRLRFDIDGNCDRWILPCPGCNKNLVVRLQ